MTSEQEILQELTTKAIRNLEEVNTYTTYLQFGMTPESVINWVGESKNSHPTQNEIDTEVIRLQAEYDSQEYARKRKAEYDALNQFELISDDAINGTTTHKDAIVAIKTKYPKG